MILEGTTSSGAVVPVQVTDQGRVVAEGLQGPQGPEGPEGPEGPPGPAGGNWERTGAVLSPTNAGDTIATSGGAVSLDPGSTGSPLVRDSAGRLLVGTASTTASATMMLNGDSNDRTFAAKLVLTNDFASPTGDRALGQILFAGSDRNTAVLLDAAADGTWSGTSTPTKLRISTTPSGSAAPVERMRLNNAGVFTLGDGTTNAVTLDPGSTGVPLMRDSVGRLLVGVNNAPAGTVAGDVVCQGAVVLQSPNGMWWAIEVEDDGTLSVAQTTVR